MDYGFYYYFFRSLNNMPLDLPKQISVSQVSVQ
jgi:hypothetical protein